MRAPVLPSSGSLIKERRFQRCHLVKESESDFGLHDIARMAITDMMNDALESSNLLVNFLVVHRF